MAENKKKLSLGIGMMAGFIVVLILFFSPIWGGQNAMSYLDNLYNSISKGSAYYIPKVKEEAAQFRGKKIHVTLEMSDEEQAKNTAHLLNVAGAEAEPSDSQVKVRGDLGGILESCLADADAMYHNEGQKLKEKYGCDERLALYNWWNALNEMEKDLKKQKLFKEAKGLHWW